MKTYHIVFKLNKETDFYSIGKDYTTNLANETAGIVEVLQQWSAEYPIDIHPNRQMSVIYLR